MTEGWSWYLTWLSTTLRLSTSGLKSQDCRRTTRKETGTFGNHLESIAMVTNTRQIIGGHIFLGRHGSMMSWLVSTTCTCLLNHNLIWIGKTRSAEKLFITRPSSSGWTRVLMGLELTLQECTPSTSISKMCLLLFLILNSSLVKSTTRMVQEFMSSTRRWPR